MRNKGGKIIRSERNADVLCMEHLIDLLRKKGDYSVREIIYELLRTAAYGRSNIHFILDEMTDEELFTRIDQMTVEVDLGVEN